MAAGSKHFGHTTEEEAMEKRIKINAESTLRSNKKAGNTYERILEGNRTGQ
jgi:hypothetical protein